MQKLCQGRQGYSESKKGMEAYRYFAQRKEISDSCLECHIEKHRADGWDTPVAEGDTIPFMQAGSGG